MAFSKELNDLIDAVISDGQITEKERVALHKRAEKEGVSPEEIEVLVESRLDEIRKRQARSTNCPICQTEIPHGISICPKCGWQRSKSVDIAASNFIQEFSKGLVLAEKQERKPSYIENYPLPNSKNDLVEFALLLKNKSFSKFDWEHYKKVNYHWAEGKKYKECIDKLQMLYPDDPQAKVVVANYKKVMKYEHDRAYNSSLSHFDGCFVSIITFIIAIVIAIYVGSKCDDTMTGIISFFASFIVIWIGYYFANKIYVGSKAVQLENIDDII